MKLIISQSQLKNITQNVILEQGAMDDILNNSPNAPTYGAGTPTANSPKPKYGAPPADTTRQKTLNNAFCSSVGGMISFQVPGMKNISYSVDQYVKMFNVTPEELKAAKASCPDSELSKRQKAINEAYCSVVGGKIKLPGSASNEEKWDVYSKEYSIVESELAAAKASCPNSELSKKMVKQDPNVNCASSLEKIKEGSIKILKYGCKTDAVKELQKLLGMEEKYQTGYFGSITKGKVKEFQTSKEGLKVDGIVGSKTYAALQQPKTPTDTSGLGVDDDIDQFNKFNMNEEKEIINENISNDIEEYRMTSRRISQQLEAFEEMVKKGDIRRANEEKGTIYKYIGRLENILMSLKRRLM